MPLPLSAGRLAATARAPLLGERPTRKLSTLAVLSQINPRPVPQGSLRILANHTNHITMMIRDNNQVTGYNSDFDASCENQPGSPTSPRHSVVIVEETEQAAEALGLDLLFNGEANKNFLNDPLDAFWMHDGNPFEADHGPASPLLGSGMHQFFIGLWLGRGSILKLLPKSFSCLGRELVPPLTEGAILHGRRRLGIWVAQVMVDDPHAGIDEERD
ncbi:hypothetical protein JB92DRAFT_3092651 [Gautieria morchelliformis]|nr:hypothetical protein JB92DRAFT_3092651 [Gautieria morchelliformis]